MKLQNSSTHRLGSGVMAVALAAAGAVCCGPASGAEPDHARETFAGMSRAASIGADVSRVPASSWVLRADAQSTVGDAFDGSGSRGQRPGELPAIETFANQTGDRHSRPGGGWVEHGDLGGDDLGEGHECERGCVGTSAVPEPGRFVLTLAGLLSVIILAKRKFRVRTHLAIAH